ISTGRTSPTGWAWGRDGGGWVGASDPIVLLIECPGGRSLDLVHQFPATRTPRSAGRIYPRIRRSSATGWQPERHAVALGADAGGVTGHDRRPVAAAAQPAQMQLEDVDAAPARER